MEIPLILYAFSAGMVATINPCGFAMLPAYVSYYLAKADGPSESMSESSVKVSVELRAQTRIAVRLTRALLVGGTLTAGFLILFAVAGSLISLGTYVIVNLMPWIGLLVGIGLVLLGAWLLFGRHLSLPWLPQIKISRKHTLGSIFVFGVAYGLASLSCTLPIFLVVVGSTFTRGSMGQGLVQFLSYGLGMGVILLALTISLALFKGLFVRRLRRLVPFVERAGAVLMMGAGLYIIYYWLTKGQLFQTIV